MNEYHSRGKEILKIFINNGYEAYFVGEAVRSIILKKSIKVIEITTSAHIEIVKKIFFEYTTMDINDYMVELKYAGYSYIVKSFINNNSKLTNSSLAKHYSKNLLDDLASRDFSINAIAMSHSGKLTDAYEGYKDIEKGLISHIGNAKDRFYKDPSLMIKAFALISELNYKLAPKTKKAISKRKKYLNQCDISLLMEDFKKMFEGVYAKKAIQTICKINVNKSVPVFKKVLTRLSQSYKKQTFEEILLMADVLNGKMNETFKFYIQDYEEYCKVYELVLNNKNSKFDSLTLYSNGLKICLIANKINYYLGRSRRRDSKINKKWNKLVIRNISELNYRVEDLQKIIKEKDYSKIPFILDEAAKFVLTGEIRNNRNEIEKSIIQVLQKNNIFYNLKGIDKFEETFDEVEKNYDTLQINNLNKQDVNKEELFNKIDLIIKDIKQTLENNEDVKEIGMDINNIDEDLYDLITNHIKKGEK